MPLSSLVLYAEPDGTHLNHSQLIDTLRAIGLIGESCGHQRYLSGSQFFNHITFLGCSPRLALTPDDGDDYLQVAIADYPEPRLLASGKSPAPLCGNCKQTLEQWRGLIAQARADRIQCPRCAASLLIADINFRKRACYARSVIQISPVFESEAIPSQMLLKSLHERFGVNMKYAYI